MFVLQPLFVYQLCRRRQGLSLKNDPDRHTGNIGKHHAEICEYGALYHDEMAHATVIICYV
jgi:hypothetical protein